MGAQDMNITLRKITHNGHELLLVSFPYHFETKEYVKRFKGVMQKSVIVYHPRRIKVNHPCRVKVSHLRRTKVNH